METPAESLVIVKPRRPWWRRWLKRIGWGLLVLLLLAAAWCAWVHYSIQKRLDETLAELDRDDPGWRLEDIEAARAVIPDEENSACVVAAAGDLLPKDWPPQEIVDILERPAPPDELDAADFLRLTNELDALRPALEQARKLADRPSGRHRITYDPIVIGTLLKDQSKVRPVTRLLLADALRREQVRDLKGALLCCRAALNSGRSLGDEPFAVSQLIRTGAVLWSCQGLERALAQGEPPADQLAAMQPLLDSEDAFPDLLIASRGERAADQLMFQTLESGDYSLSRMAAGRKDWDERLFGFMARDGLRTEHPLLLSLLTRWIAVTELPMWGQADAEEQLLREADRLPSWARFSHLLTPAIPKIGARSRCKHACLRCLIAAFAAERYRQQHKQWPDSLDHLCPRYLAEVPLDPFDGSPLRYCRRDDGVVIYSISTDGIDDGGHLDPKHANQPGVDVGVRLWDVAKRRQPPAPKPPEDDPRR